MKPGEIFNKATITDASAVRDFGVFINGFEVKKNDIQDIQINFGEPSKKGSVTINDTLNYAELSIVNSAEILVQYTDANQQTFSETFIATKVMSNRDSKNIPVLDIFFEDLDTFMMKNIYQNFHFQNVTAVQAISNIFKQLRIGIGAIDSEDAPVFETIVVPINESLWDWILRFTKLHGVEIVRDKFTSYISYYDKMYFRDLPSNPEGVYSFDDNEKSYRRITEYSYKMADKNATNGCPVYVDQTFDYENDSNRQAIIEFGDTYANEKLNQGIGIPGRTFEDNFFTIGMNARGNTLTNTTVNGFRESLNDNQVMEIFMAGINKDRLFTKIAIALPRTQNAQGEDSIFSGTYVITKSIDKISNDKYFTQITLQRSDYGEGVKVGT